MTSTVTCGYTGASWENNSSGQNACQVYAALEGHCNSGFSIGDVTTTSPPYKPQNDQCTCNLVAYNLQAACGWCQTSILSNWWLTEAQWAGNCTTASYDATGIPASVTSGVNIPSWAFLANVGDTWSPSLASAAAVTGTGIINSIPATATAVGGASIPNNGFSYSYNPYTYNSGDDPYYWNAVYGASVASWAIAVGVVAGIYALMGIIMGVVYFMRQKKRKAWYGPMAQYYRQRGVGGYQGNYAAGGAYQPPYNNAGYNPGAGPAGVPLLYNNDANVPGSPHTKHTSLYGGNPSPAPTGYSGGQYQPPPPETNPFSTPYATPGEIQYSQPGFGAPPQGPPPGAGGSGYRGHAEVY